MQETVVKKIFRDDTRLWLETSTPNSHNVEIRNFITKDGVTYIVDGKSVTFDISNKELKIAAWLERKFGGSYQKLIHQIIYKQLTIYLEMNTGT